MTFFPRAVLLAALPVLLLGCKDKDNNLADDTDPVTVGLENSSPVITLYEPIAGTVYSWNESIIIDGRVSDDDVPTKLAVDIYSDKDGFVAEGVMDPYGRLVGEVEGLSYDDHTLTIRVTDPDDASDEVEVTVVVAENRAPTTPVIAITPSSPESDEDLQAVTSVASSDPDGDAITYLWAWTVDGVETGLTGNKVPSKYTDEQQVWTATAIATDGGEESASVSTSVTIGQAGPEVTIDIDPLQPDVSDTLTCTYHAGDPYGGEVSVSSRWLIGEDDHGTAEVPLTGVFRKDDVVTCEVDAKSDRGTTVEDAAVQILNSAPTISAISITPSVAYTDTDLTCEPTTVDADPDDEISFAWEWFVEDPVSGIVTSVGDTVGLNSSNFVRDDYVWCAAQADDGVEISSWRSSGVLIIQNSRPSTPTVDLGSSALVAGATANCSIATPAYDLDFDHLIYEYRWTIDGSVQEDSDNAFEDTADLSGTVLGCSTRAVEVAGGGLASDWSGEATVQVID